MSNQLPYPVNPGGFVQNTPDMSSSSLPYPTQNPGYPPPGTTEHPPNGNPGYPPTNMGYSPGNPSFPPVSTGSPGYPSGSPGYPPGNPGYPIGNPGYPPGNPGYPPGNSEYPVGNPGYLPQGNSNYPPVGTGSPGYPPVSPGYLPPNLGYPPLGPGYPPPGNQGNPQGNPRPSLGYEASNPGYPPITLGYPPLNPTQSQAYSMYPQIPESSTYPSAPSDQEPFTSRANVEMNQGPGLKSKLVNSALSSGMKIAKDALDKSSLGKYLPKDLTSFSDNLLGKGQKSSHDAPDGNCLGSGSTYPSGSSTKPMSGSVGKFANQDYHELKRQYKSRGVLFEDPEFPASNKLLVDDNNQFIVSYFGRTRFEQNSIEWLRPQEICQRNRISARPKMFVDQADRFDINQGEIGNCWFLAAVANLAENKRCFDRVVPRDQDFDSHDYAGIFRFRFWRFGSWLEIVIDDRLPTRNGKLIYLRSVAPNEFWGALLEKAYAKLHGSYRALEGGLTIEAAVDFTGGIPELIDLERSPYSKERLFYIMTKADSRDAFMGCALTNDSRRAQEAQRKGLQSRHAYTITKVVEIRSRHSLGGIPLIRLRNPHGNSREWRGDWSDDDRNWRLIPEHKRKELGLTFEDDGEFYMSFRDFLTYFGELEICHLAPDSYDFQDANKSFEVFHFFGEWNFGHSAGGCGNDGHRAFATNPQFFINLNDPDPYDDVSHCPVVISLMQRQNKRKSEHAIGFKIFQCDLTAKKLDERFLTYNKSIDRTDTFINLREVSKRMILPAGRYCIIPCTFKQGEEGHFLLRVFVEKHWGSSEGGRGHAVNDAMDSGGKLKDVTDGLERFGITDQKKSGGGKKGISGFALKQLEKNFPKGMKQLKDFYKWATTSEDEFNLLKTIMKTI